MASMHKIGYLYVIALLLCIANAHSQEAPTIPANSEPTPLAESADVAKINTPTTKKKPVIDAPHIANLTCPEILGISPLLSLTAKAKQGEQYQSVRLGCLDLAFGDALLDETSLLGLNEAAEFIMNSPDFIRIYIDLEDAGVKEQGLLKRFRTKAFAVRNVLTQKGVYSHLKANREGVFPSAFAKKGTPTKKQTETKAKPVVVAKKPPKPRNPSLDYAFHVDRDQTFTSEGNLGVYGNDTGQKGFQFIPMQSVYFIHDEYKLTSRAQATLLAMVNYILQHPETDKLIIQSHADDTGSDNYNFRLTDRRALAVKDFVIENGLPEEIVEIISRGEMDPVDEYWTRQGKARNRRVELYVIQRSAQL